MEAVGIGPNGAAPQANHGETICVGPSFSYLEQPVADAVATVFRVDDEPSDLREWLRLEHVAPIDMDPSGQPLAGAFDKNGAVVGLQSTDRDADGFGVNGYPRSFASRATGGASSLVALRISSM